MADNQEEFEKYKNAKSSDEFLTEMEGKADPFAGFNLEDLQALATTVSQFNDSPAKKAIMDSIEAQRSKLEAQNAGNNADSMEVELPSEEFANLPSYDALATVKDLVSKDDQLMLDVFVADAQKMVDMVDLEHVTPDNAVSLKDYIEIIRTGKELTEEENANLTALETKVDEQLVAFDKENGLDGLEGVDTQTLTARESGLHNYKRNNYVNLSEQEEVIHQLAIQQLKVLPSEEINQDAYKEKVADLTEQFNLAIGQERAVMFADEGFMHTHKMTEQDLGKLVIGGENGTLNPEEQKLYEELLTKRQKATLDYSEQFAQLDSNDYAHILAASKLQGTSLDINSKEFKDFKQDFLAKDARIHEATMTAYAMQVDQLANRTARITKADNLQADTHNFLQEYAKKHPTMYGYGKVAKQAAKKAAITQLISMSTGLTGLAAYSAYNTYKEFNKAYDEHLKNGGEKGFKNFWKQLPKDKKIDLVKQTALTGITATAAIVTHASGLGLAAEAAAPLINRVGKAVASIGAESLKVVSNVKDMMNAKDEETKKASKSKLKKSLLGLGIAAAGAVGLGWAAKYFLGDSNGDSNLDSSDEKLIKEFNPNNEGMSNEEREQLLDKWKEMNTPAPEKTPLEELQDRIREGNAGNGNDNPTSVQENTEQNGSTTEGLENFSLSAEDTEFLKKEITNGPNAILRQLGRMGVLSEEDAKTLQTETPAVDGRAVASRGVGSYLGYNKIGDLKHTEVSVHANLTPEQQKELIDYLHSEQYKIDCDELNGKVPDNDLAHDNKERIAKLREQINGNGNANNEGAKVVEENTQQNTQTSVNEEKANATANPTPSNVEQPTVTEEKKSILTKIQAKKEFLGGTISLGAKGTVNAVGDGTFYDAQRAAAIDAHANGGGRHFNTEAGNVKGDITVRGNVPDRHYSVTAEYTDEDGNVTKEKIKVRKDVVETTYSKGGKDIVKDIGGIHVEGKEVQSININGQRYSAVVGNDGKGYFVYEDAKGNNKIQEMDIKEAKKIVSKATLTNVYTGTFRS